MLASAFLFVTGIVIARALGPAGKGFYDLVVGSATLLATLTGLSMSSGVFFWVSRGNVDIRRLIAVAGAVAVLQGSVAAAALWYAGAQPWIAWMLPDRQSGETAVLIGVTLAVVQAQQLVHAVAKGRGCFRAFAISELLAKGGMTLAAAALLIAGVARAPAYVMALALASTIAVLVLIGGVRGPSAPGAGLPLRAMLSYSLPLFLGNIVQFLNYRLDIFLVKNFLGLSAVGTYTVAVWLAQTIWLAPTQLAALVMRTAAERGGGPSVVAYVARINRFSFLMSTVLALGLAAVGGLGMSAIFGRDFHTSVVPLLLLLPGVAVFSSTIILSAYLNGVQRQAVTTWVACGSLVITVGANLVLVPRIGVPGAAVTSTLSYAASTLATILVVRRVTPQFRFADFFLPQRGDWQVVRYGLRGALAWVRGPATLGW